MSGLDSRLVAHPLWGRMVDWGEADSLLAVGFIERLYLPVFYRGRKLLC